MKKKYLISFLIIVALVLVFSVFYTKIKANKVPADDLTASASKSGGNTSTLPALGNFSGYAWSENIGWIDMSGVSFNATNINVNTGNINLNGYGWSENVGWVSFNENTGCGVASCKPQINIKNGTFSGWARVLSMQSTGDVNNDNEMIEWADGWINLYSSANPAYGVACQVTVSSNINTTLPGGTCAGYAWGGNVTGWVDFSNVTTGTLEEEGGETGDGSITLYGDTPGSTLYPNPTSGMLNVPNGTNVHLSWGGNNLSPNMPNCKIVLENNNMQKRLPTSYTLPLNSAMNLNSNNTTGLSAELNSVPNGTYKYTMTCLGVVASGMSNTPTFNSILTVNVLDPANMPIFTLTSPHCNQLVFTTKNITQGLTCSMTKDSNPMQNPYFNLVTNSTKTENNVPTGKYGITCGAYSVSGVTVEDKPNGTNQSTCTIDKKIKVKEL